MYVNFCNRHKGTFLCPARIYTLICLLLLPFYAAPQVPAVRGEVLEMSSGRKKVSGVLVYAAAPARTNRVLTGADGVFTLFFQDMFAGENIFVQAEKQGWVIVNEKEMQTLIPSRVGEQQLKIIMSPAKKIEQARLSYYRISNEYLTKAYEKKIAAIDRSRKGWELKVKSLNDSVNGLRQMLNAISEEYSRTNLDEVSEVEKKAIAFFKAGKIEESIKLRESLKSDSAILEIIKRRKEEDSLIRLHTLNLTRLAEEYILSIDFASAENTYERLAKADTGNAANLLRFSLFLMQQNNYTKAMPWLNRALRHTGDSELQAGSVYSLLAFAYLKKKDPLLMQFSLDTTEKIFRRLAVRLPGKFGHVLAQIYTLQAGRYEMLQDYSGAERAYFSAVQVLRQAGIENEQIEYSRASLSINMGNFYKTRQQYGKAASEYNAANLVLTKLAKNKPHEYYNELAIVRNNLSIFFIEQQQYNAAEKIILETIGPLREEARLNPAFFEPVLYTMQNNLSILYLYKGNLPASEKAAGEAFGIYKKQLSAGVLSEIDQVAAFQRSGAMLMVLGKFEEAKIAYKRALDILYRLSKNTLLVFDADIVTCENNLGRVWFELKQFAESEKMYLSACEKLRGFTLMDSSQFLPLLAISYSNLGTLYLAIKNYPASLLAFSNAMQIHQRLALVNPVLYEPGLANSYKDISELWLAMDKYDTAESSCQAAIKIFRRLTLLNPSVFQAELAAGLKILGDIYTSAKRYSEAEKAYLEELELTKHYVSEDTVYYAGDLAIAYNTLGSFYYKKKDFDASSKAHRSALEIYRRLAAKNNHEYEPSIAFTQDKFVDIYMEQGKLDSASYMVTASFQIYTRLKESDFQQYGLKYCENAMMLCGFYNLRMKKENVFTVAKLLPEIKQALAKLPASEAKSQFDNGLKMLNVSFEMVAVPAIVGDLPKRIAGETDLKTKIGLQKELIAARKTLAGLGFSSQQVQIGKEYGELSWNLIRCRKFAEAEMAAKNALFPGYADIPAEYNKKCEWVYTKLAVALVLQNKFTGSLEIYRRLKDMPYKQGTYKDVFLGDIEELEKMGIKHPGFTKVRNLLNDQ